MDPLILGSLFKVAEGILDRIFPDPDKRAAAQLDLVKLQQSGELAKLASFTDLAKAQIALNTAEVQSGSFLGKWRGGLGWVLSGSLAYQLILHPFLVAGLLIFDPAFPVDKLPKLDWQSLGKLLIGMLGLA